VERQRLVLQDYADLVRTVGGLTWSRSGSTREQNGPWKAENVNDGDRARAIAQNGGLQLVTGIGESESPLPPGLLLDEVGGDAPARLLAVAA